MPDLDHAFNERPSPEALLEAARREDSRIGKLRIFVGAAPGVGKTYEMLRTARDRRKDGYDVVIGVVETHGRKETQALLRGLEVIPRRRVEYRGQTLEEMDLDAILARRPQLVLVDELAHTNAHGSRHPKRYLDVEEILNHGIDVYTTVNIQHIESLNDIVAQITRVRVRETVPDAIFDRADAVELVDLTPGDLIERLKAGKVYIPKQAERALEHFFSPANLTALRELALRRTAERVDDQLLTEMRARAIPGPWAAGERILVCVTEDPRAAGLVRYAKRVADRLRAPWSPFDRNATEPATERGGARSHFRRPAAGRADGRRGHHCARRLEAHRRRHPGVRAGTQRDADHRREIGTGALVRNSRRFCCP
jgi:two-component system sensor histidine kinase KdpD